MVNYACNYMSLLFAPFSVNNNMLHFVKGMYTCSLYVCFNDIVEIVGNRRLRIIDRIKNFFKLSQVRTCMHASHMNRYIHTHMGAPIIL